jgi:hypothetical protein
VTESIGLGPSPCQPIVDMCSVVRRRILGRDPLRGLGEASSGTDRRALARVRWKARLRTFPGLQDSTCTRDSS